MTINDFIKKRPYLIWYTKNFDNLSADSIVEAVLNYGNWDDVQEMFKILGIKRASKIFHKQIKQRRCNYHEKSKNYFALYFKQHVYA